MSRREREAVRVFLSPSARWLAMAGQQGLRIANVEKKSVQHALAKNKFVEFVAWMGNDKSFWYGEKTVGADRFPDCQLFSVSVGNFCVTKKRSSIRGLPTAVLWDDSRKRLLLATKYGSLYSVPVAKGRLLECPFCITNKNVEVHRILGPVFIKNLEKKAVPFYVTIGFEVRLWSVDDFDTAATRN